jgi:hypothetical protein
MMKNMALEMLQIGQELHERGTNLINLAEELAIEAQRADKPKADMLADLAGEDLLLVRDLVKRLKKINKYNSLCMG